MHAANILRILGLLLAIFSSTMLPPTWVAKWYAEPKHYSFIIATAITLLLGLALWYPLRKKIIEPRPRDGFLIVCLFWIVLCFVGCLPFVLSQYNISFVDALFETVSGLTATGSTIFTNIDSMPRSILYYRQQLQFLGGMGIIVLAIAIMPALGIGGVQLFRAEFSGPIKDNKLTPRITHTAKAIWSIYIGLTIFCIIAYWAAGMDLFDAIGYGFGTVSTGGYTTHEQSIGYFNNPQIMCISMIFMLLSATNFYLHFLTMRHASLKHYWQNSEFKIFILIILAASIIIGITLFVTITFNDINTAMLEALFQVISLATTTGFFSADFNSWPLFCSLLLLGLGIIGGCGGSTSGGIKVIRAILLQKNSAREINRLIHPHAHYAVTLDRQPIASRVLDIISAFISLYLVIYIIFVLLLTATGLDFLTAFSATAAALSNIGPGLGQVAQNFYSISDLAKIILSAGMLIGRLEIFTVLIVLSTVYWKD